MKKSIALLLMLILTATAAGCSQSSAGSDESSITNEAANSASADIRSTASNPSADLSDSMETSINEVAQSIPESGSSILVAYFSMPETAGVDAVAGASRVVRDGIVVGNTQLVAQWISQEVGGELFQIQTVQAYPGDHDELVDFADEELAANARPELATHIENLSQYGTIFIGYPNWWGDLPMPLYTFLEEYDFSGKRVIPFSTHGGSGFSGTIRTITELEPGATVEQEGLTISRNSVADARAEVNTWLDKLEIVK